MTLKKNNTDKIDFTLLPFDALRKAVVPFEIGAKKYGAQNWRECTEEQKSRYKKALLRHLWSYMEGDLIDEDSGESHLSHLAANVLILLALESDHE